MRHWRIGRGRTVDRKALLDSNAVSDKYIDRLSELAVELAGDGAALIKSLEGGSVRGFRSEKRIALEEHLATLGYTDDRDVLTPDQIGHEVHPVLYNELEQGLITLEQFDMLITLIIEGPNLTQGPVPR